MSEPERLLDREEVAKVLGLSTITVGRMMRAGTLPAFKLGRQWRVRPADLDAYLRRLAEKQGGEA